MSRLRFFSRVALAALMAVFLAAPALGAPPSKDCVDFLENAGGHTYQDFFRYNEIQPLKEAESFVNERLGEMRLESSRLKAQIKSQPGSRAAVADVIGVGVGLAFSTFAVNAKAAKPNLRIIGLEAGNTVSSIFNKANGFDMNSPTIKGIKDENIFPGSATQVKDLMALARKQGFPPAKFMGWVATLAAAQSGAEIMFHSKVTGILDSALINAMSPDHPVHWHARYRVETEDGVAVYGNTVMIGVGLGTPNYKINQSAQTLFATETELQRAIAEKMPLGAQSVDMFLHYVSEVGRTEDPAANFESRIIIIGDGDGSKVAVERFLGKRSKSGQLFNIYWVGQKAKTASEFVTNEEHHRPNLESVPRYLSISDGFLNGQIIPIAGRGISLAKTENSGTGRPEYVLSLDKGAEKITGDHVISSTGYSDLVESLLSTLTAESQMPIQISLEDVYGRPAGFSSEVNIGRRVRYVTQNESPFMIPQPEVYLYGVNGGAANGLGRNALTGATQWVRGPRTALLAKMIADQVKPLGLGIRGGHGLDPHILTLASGKRVGADVPSIADPLPMDPKVAEIEARFYLGLILKDLRTPFGALVIDVTNDRGQLNLMMNGYGPEAHALLGALVQNQGLASALQALYAAGGSFSIKVPTDSKGAPDLENIIIEKNH